MIEAEKTYEHILFEQDGAVAYVTMNRPKKRNALSLEHMRELISLFKEIGERQGRLGGHPARRGSRLLRGPRPLGDGRKGSRILPPPLRRLLRTHGDYSGDPTACDRAGPRRRHRRRLPARRHLRPRGRLRGSTVRHARCQDRAVLLHPDGRLEPGRRPEKIHGDAPHGRVHLSRGSPRGRTRQPGGFG